ncbi:hypothetical protein O0L34_g15547 [Tuta absoluta]|nr:hypothetical protein O0L34_g15547 [Tuta absoluta]
MRSALICVFFALLVRRGSLADDDFRPMPIPLNEWHHDRRDSRAGTLHETIKTDAPPSVAAVPAHYWEDALRHSVYLTLVRDKIDQLIAKGEVISPDSKPDQYVSKDIDDHDLWEKIKTAPFDRIQEEEPSSFGDVTIMAIGRLIEEKNGFRFTEDERSKEKCKDEKCMDGVKAFWSVKRVRQREVETSPGKYHYELTFSVSSQHPKKQKKPYENPVRTFTVKETNQNQALDMPQEHRAKEKLRILPPGHPPRPTRAIWFHKNIVPTQGRQIQHGLDRIFSSFFSDDDDDYEPPRYRPHVQPTPPQHPQYAKMGYVSSPSDQQKRLTPYPYRPQTVYKYTRPIGPPPPYHQHPHHQFIGSVETDSAGHSYQDFRFGPPPKPIRTTRPAVLPTPLPPAPTNKTESDSEKQTTQIVKQNVTEAPFIQTTDVKTIHKTVHKYRPGPMKINYLPDHVRPPIYNAPPGVFVTMDKKPFKPMPPLKFHNKPLKHKPIDFRPSPQVLDMQQFSEPDPQHDTAFRPITWNHYAEKTTTEKAETTADVAESSTQVNKTRKTTHKGKKPPKKHENIQPSRTTSAPEIITASSDSGEESDAMQWANVVGAFSKTTPVASEKKSEVPESTTPTTTSSSTTTTAATTTTTVKRRTTTTTEAPEETTTTRKPRTKRTRPPPKFAKPNTLKKHKRITTTTTQAPEVKPTQDLTPQASSVTASKPPKPSTTTSTAKPNTTTATSTTTTTRPTPTTTRPTTTTTKATTTTKTTTQSPKPESKDTVSTTQPKIKNRFRQSTLMTKGTSVKHDKWTAPTSPDKSKTTGPAATSSPTGRRKGSNFHGYVSSTTPRNDKEYTKFHEDKGPIKPLTVKPLATTTQSYEETVDQYENNGESSDYTGKDNENFEDEPSGTEEQESRDHLEYIFQSTTPSERTNEVDVEPITTEQIITSPLSAPKNKTKCKKKKTQNSTTTEDFEESNVEQTTSTMSVVPITTTEVSTPSIFEELFGSFTVDDRVEDSKKSPSTMKPDLQEQGSEKHGQFVKLDDDLQDFLDSLERDSRDVDVEEEYEEDEESEPSIDDEEEVEDGDSPTARDMAENYEKYETVEDYKRPYSLFELMAMD